MFFNWLGRFYDWIVRILKAGWTWLCSHGLFTGKKEYDFWLGFALTIGTVFMWLFAMTQPNKLWQTFAICLLIAGAASAAGILVGFLFGIPRSPKRDPTGEEAGQALEVNTNLTEISDWLTKIIVGVGLVEMSTIPTHLMSMANYLGTAFGTTKPVPSAVVNLIVVYFAIFSFLLGYLWTRLYLAGEFSKAERVARERPEFVEGMVHALLYQPKPDGFTEATKKAKEYQTRYGKSNDRIWAYLACAYGQQYSYLKDVGATDQKALDRVRDDALEAAQNAAELSPSAKRLLFSLWSPDRKNRDDDDLEAFANDPKFQQFFADLTANRVNVPTG